MGRGASKSETLADLGLVALVVGGAFSLLLGIVTLGIGALLGRIPLFLAVLLGLSMLVTVAGLAVTVAAGQNREREGEPLPSPEESS